MRNTALNTFLFPACGINNCDACHMAEDKTVACDKCQTGYYKASDTECSGKCIVSELIIYFHNATLCQLQFRVYNRD